MFLVSTLPIAIFLCFLTMIGWGSWANTQKFAGADRWRFELYYWDYAIGVFLTGVIFALTFGQFGPAAPDTLTNLSHASASSIRSAFLSGAIFNLSNVLLVVAIDAAGMTVAFPVGVGLALILGTVGSYLQTPKGDPTLIAAGVFLILAAMISSSIASSKLKQAGKSTIKGLIYAISAGCLMGFFYPELAKTLPADFHVTQPGQLTPYSALLLFGTGLLISNLVINTFFMRAGKVTYAQYFEKSKVHFLGIAGGAIWMLALSFNILASGVAGPAISYALGQCATLIASIWGIFVWKEFRNAPAGTNIWIAAMFLNYLAGIVLIGAAIL